MQNCCNSTYNSLAPRKIFEHINELWCGTIVSQKCNGNPRTDNKNRQISHVMRKPMFYISRNKCTDQLHTNKEADQHLYFHYSVVIFNIVIVPFLYSLNPKFRASKPIFVVVQPDLCGTPCFIKFGWKCLESKQCRSRSDDAFYAASVLVLLPLVYRIFICVQLH